MGKQRMIFHALRYDTSEPVQIEIEAGRTRAVTPLDPATAERERLPWVAPALFDVQINGRGGQSFASADLTPEKVAEVLRPHFAFGLTRMCPTLVTASLETLEAGMARQLEEIDAIAGNPEPASFENTIVAMEGAGRDLDRVFTYWRIWSANRSTPEFREIQQEMARQPEWLRWQSAPERYERAPRGEQRDQKKEDSGSR